MKTDKMRQVDAERERQTWDSDTRVLPCALKPNRPDCTAANCRCF